VRKLLGLAAVLFGACWLAGVGVAQPPIPQPEQIEVAEGGFVKLASGDFKLWATVNVKGKAGESYAVFAYCYDANLERMSLMETEAGAHFSWPLPVPYDGSAKTNTFVRIVPAGSYWAKQIETYGNYGFGYVNAELWRNGETLAAWDDNDYWWIPTP
jgi:hypothetical protein